MSDRGPTLNTMERIFWQLIGILSLIGFVGAYFWWIMAGTPLSRAPRVESSRLVGQGPQVGIDQRRQPELHRNHCTNVPATGCQQLFENDP